MVPRDLRSVASTVMMFRIESDQLVNLNPVSWSRLIDPNSADATSLISSHASSTSTTGMYENRFAPESRTAQYSADTEPKELIQSCGVIPPEPKLVPV